MKKQQFACPSATNTEGASLFGIVGNDGKVKFLPDRVPLSEELIQQANQKGNPESRMRFTNTCAENGCRQWTGHDCGVIKKIQNHVSVNLEEKIQRCPIMSECRWYFQEGINACKICPLIVADLV